MRHHCFPPIVCSCSNVPMKCNPFSTSDHSRKKKIESNLLKPVTYHITVRPLNSTIDQRSEMQKVNENEHPPTVPCRRIVSDRNQVHVRSTSFLCSTAETLDEKKSPRDELISAPRSNENIGPVDSTKRARFSFDDNNNTTSPLQQQNTKVDDSVTTRTADKIEDTERRDHSVIERKDFSAKANCPFLPSFLSTSLIE